MFIGLCWSINIITLHGNSRDIKEASGLVGFNFALVFNNTVQRKITNKG